MLWLASVIVAGCCFSHTIQISRYNQPLLNHICGGGGEKNPKTQITAHLWKKKSISCLSRDILEVCILTKNSLVQFCSTQRNVLIPLTCQGILGLKERTEASFHVCQTPLILLGSLLLQITGCTLQLFKTEKTELSHHYIRPVVSWISLLFLVYWVLV